MRKRQCKVYLPVLSASSQSNRDLAVAICAVAAEADPEVAADTDDDDVEVFTSAAFASLPWLIKVELER